VHNSTTFRISIFYYYLFDKKDNVSTTEYFSSITFIIYVFFIRTGNRVKPITPILSASVSLPRGSQPRLHFPLSLVLVIFHLPGCVRHVPRANVQIAFGEIKAVGKQGHSQRAFQRSLREGFSQEYPSTTRLVNGISAEK